MPEPYSDQEWQSPYMAPESPKVLGGPFGQISTFLQIKGQIGTSSLIWISSFFVSLWQHRTPVLLHMSAQNSLEVLKKAPEVRWPWTLLCPFLHFALSFSHLSQFSGAIGPLRSGGSSDSSKAPGGSRGPDTLHFLDLNLNLRGNISPVMV